MGRDCRARAVLRFSRMRKLLFVFALFAVIACNRDKVETRTPDSGANQNVVDTAASGTAIPDATATDVTLPIGGTPADASAVTESMKEAATETSATTTAEPPKDTAPAPTGQIADGQSIFRTSCAGCHGADGKKPVRGHAIVSPETQQKPDAELARMLRAAPTHKRLNLDEKQIAAVIAYVKALK